MKKALVIIICILAVTLATLHQASLAQFKKTAQNTWRGIASYYHPKFNGRKTSTGEIFSNAKLTAANNFLKLGTYVKITNPKNNKSVVVKINDRMNARNKRLIDLSQAAAQKLGLIHQGIGEVVMEVLEPSSADLVVHR